MSKGALCATSTRAAARTPGTPAAPIPSRGAPATIASVMPVSTEMNGGIGTPGLTSVWNSPSTSPAAHLDRADLGDLAARRRAAGGLQVDHHEGHLVQRRAQLVERRLHGDPRDLSTGDLHARLVHVDDARQTPGHNVGGAPPGPEPFGRTPEGRSRSFAPLGRLLGSDGTGPGGTGRYPLTWKRGSPGHPSGRRHPSTRARFATRWWSRRSTRRSPCRLIEDLTWLMDRLDGPCEASSSTTGAATTPRASSSRPSG